MERVWRTAVEVEFEVGPIVEFNCTTVKLTNSLRRELSRLRG